MSKLVSINVDVTGQIGINPRRVTIVTKDNLSTVTTAGYLNTKNLLGNTIYSTDEIVMFYGYVSPASPGVMGIFNAAVSAKGIITLTEWVNPGDVVTPTVANNIAIFNNTTGQLIDSGVHFSSLLNTVVPTLAGSQTNYFAVFTSNNSLDKVAASGTGISPGNIQAGLSGTPGAVASFPPTAGSGSLILKANDNAGDFIIALRNADFGQASTLTFPDPGAASANVLLDTGSANILIDFQQFLGIDTIIGQTAGTWTTVRNTAGDWSQNKQAAADTSVTGFDITPAIRTAASKGFELRSIDVIYGIATENLNAHTATLTKANYVNNAGITLTSTGLTGSLATATQANLYVTNLQLSSPAFLNTAVSKYVFELTVNAATTSAYVLYGINLHFYQTIG